MNLPNKMVKGAVENQNGLIRCFIPKGKRISDYRDDDILFIFHSMCQSRNIPNGQAWGEWIVAKSLIRTSPGNEKIPQASFGKKMKPVGFLMPHSFNWFGNSCVTQEGQRVFLTIIFVTIDKRVLRKLVIIPNCSFCDFGSIILYENAFKQRKDVKFQWEYL